MCEPDASTPANARMNVAKMAQEPALVKSGKKSWTPKWICTGLPCARYMMVNTKKMTDVPRMPIMKPHLAIAAVTLVPRSCRNVMAMKME